MYSFKHIDTKTPYTVENIMAAKSGMEGRYSNRFTRYAGTTDDAIRNIDEAGKVVENSRIAAGVVEGQKNTINQLFLSAETAITGINQFQNLSGSQQINNIPLPGEAVQASYGKKLGYVKLVIDFLEAGLLHFMEESMNLDLALKDRDKTIRAIAHDSSSIDLIGEMEDIKIDDLLAPDPVDVSTYEISKSEKTDKSNPTPPMTPTAKVNGKPKKK